MSAYNAKGNISHRRQYRDQKSSNLHKQKSQYLLMLFFYFYLSFFSYIYITSQPQSHTPLLLPASTPPPFLKGADIPGFEANTHNKLQKTRHKLSSHSPKILNTLSLIVLGFLISLSLTTEQRVYIYLFTMAFGGSYLRLWLEC